MINGRLISEPMPLKNGDELTLGETVLTVQIAHG
ncbi:MAG: FHA domain-containing protein [Anaerolineae bacterium]